jgi:hypothetical protein
MMQSKKMNDAVAQQRKGQAARQLLSDAQAGFQNNM